MKVCFYSRALYSRLCPLLYGELSKRLAGNVSAIFVTQNSGESSIVRSICEDAEVIEVAAWFREHWSEFTEENLARYEKKFHCPPIWSLIHTDRFLVGQSREYVISVACGYFALYDGIFEGGDFDVYYDESIALLSSYIAYYVSKYYGVQYLAQVIARGNSSTHHYFTSDPYQHNCNFDDNFENLEHPREVLEAAEQFVSGFEQQNTVPAYMKITGRKPRLRVTDLSSPLLYYRYRKAANTYDYIDKERHLTAFDSVKFYWRYRRSKSSYRQPDLSRKYVLFPLHFQPEASTLVCAPKYENQMFFIDSWAKSLPGDTLLYVKEHYAILGHRRSSFYEELIKYPNVVLIDPWFDTRVLIENAEAVTTLTGTAGWEAMLLRKPTILGGHIVFDNAPGVIRVDDVYGAYADAMKQWRKPSREQLVRYIAEYLTTIYEGSIYTVDAACYSADNISRLGLSLLAQLERMELVSRS